MKKIMFLLTFIGIQISYLYAQSNSETANNQSITYITCRIKNSIKHDTLSLILDGSFWTYQLHVVPERYSSQTLTAAADANGEYKFKIKSDNSPFHVTLFLSSKRNEDGYLNGQLGLSNYLIMPGKDIHIDFDGDMRIFTGMGETLFEVQDKIERTDKGHIVLLNNDHGYLGSDTQRWLKEKDSLLNVQLDLLNTYRTKLAPLAYSIVRADLIGQNRGSVYERMSFTPSFLAPRKDLTKPLAEVYDELEKTPAYFNWNDNVCLSPKYIYYLYEKIKLEVKHDRILAKLPPKMDQDYFQRIKSDYTGVVRDKLLARWIMEVAAVNNLQPQYAPEALALMQTPSFIQIVNNLNSAYQKGQPVTDFGFVDSKGRTIYLGDFKGKVVVVDMWFSGCAECISVAAGMPYVESQFKDRVDVVFLTISIDRNKDTWLKSIDEKDGKYYITPFTTYLYTAGTGDKNPFIERYVPDGSYPQILIIGKDGKMFSAKLPHPINEKLEKEFVKRVFAALESKS